MVGVGVLLSLNGCATEAGGGFGSSLTPARYTQLSEDQCAGVPADERELGVLAYRGEIAGAQRLKEEYAVGKMKLTRDRGVRIGLRAEPGMSGPAACGDLPRRTG